MKIEEIEGMVFGRLVIILYDDDEYSRDKQSHLRIGFAYLDKAKKNEYCF